MTVGVINDTIVIGIDSNGSECSCAVDIENFRVIGRIGVCVISREINDTRCIFSNSGRIIDRRWPIISTDNGDSGRGCIGPPISIRDSVSEGIGSRFTDS